MLLRQDGSAGGHFYCREELEQVCRVSKCKEKNNCGKTEKNVSEGIEVTKCRE